MRELDSNGSGEIEMEEFKRLLGSLKILQTAKSSKAVQDQHYVSHLAHQVIHQNTSSTLVGSYFPSEFSDGHTAKLVPSESNFSWNQVLEDSEWADFVAYTTNALLVTSIVLAPIIHRKSIHAAPLKGTSDRHDYRVIRQDSIYI